MICNELSYEYGGQLFRGLLAFQESARPRPAVLLAHDWSGRNEFVVEKARKLAACGFVAYAIDMYGDAKTGNSNDEKLELMTPLIEDRERLSGIVNAAYVTIKNKSMVDKQRIAAMGYCFGGLVVLDLARSGADVKGVISLHGNLTPPAVKQCVKINASVLALHGYADPMVPPSAIDSFAEEMTGAGVDWQLHAYGNVLHAFTNPEAQDHDFGTVYNEIADKRAWQTSLNFFDEIF